MPSEIAFEFLLGLLLTIFVLSLVARAVGLPPAAAFIVGGSLLALLPGMPSLELNPDLVIILFLPPLLMSDAYTTAWRDIRENISGILSLALGAVVFTTLLVGLVTHWIVPSLPWAVCFALGAIVSPPDAVAAEAVLSRLSLPGRVTVLLRGESLLNDAAGLVLFRFAVAAALTGSFSAGQAVGSFVTLLIGGVAVGAAFGYAGSALFRWLQDASLTITASVLLAWASYIGGEALHVSGVLSTVVCGMIIGWNQHEDLSADVRVRTHAFWQVLVFLLESMVFILIGLSVRGVLSRFHGGAALALVVPTVSVIAAVIVSRFLWIGGSSLLRGGLARARRRPRPETALSFGMVTVMSWAGMRGVVSLAAALSVPETLPGRDLILVATFGVILVTVLVQSTTLAPLIRRLRLGGDRTLDQRQLSEAAAWSRMAHAQLSAVTSASRQQDGTERHPRLLEQYSYRARVSIAFAADNEAHRPAEIEHFTVVLQAIAAGRAEVLRMYRAGELHHDVMGALEQELDLQEMTAALYRG